MKNINYLLLTLLFSVSLKSFSQNYTFPNESEQHEGTWLQWPHGHEYGASYMTDNNATWVAMTDALQANEKVHIIYYDATHKIQILNLLSAASVPTTNVTFHISQTNDVWARDDFGVFLRNTSGALILGDFGFNGWGGDYNFAKDNLVPAVASAASGIPLLDLNNTITVEGGAWELDGTGTFLATKSSILSQANPTTPAGIKSIRNLGMTQAQAEAIFTQYIGATKFIWLDGWFSTDDITDAHIDGFAKFVPGNKLVTMSQADLLYWGVPLTDINILFAASDANNITYTKVFLPLTANDVLKTNGTSLGYKGSYANYYVANNRVLVPNYNDPNDVVANTIIAGLYPGRTVVGINVQNLYGNGGMVHCVTQQQPLPLTTTGLNDLNPTGIQLEQNFPNPFSDLTTLTLTLKKQTLCKLDVYNVSGEIVLSITNTILDAGEHAFTVNAKELATGIYTCVLITDNLNTVCKKIIISK